MKNLKLTATQCSILYNTLIAQKNEHHAAITRHQKGLDEIDALIAQLMSKEIKTVAGNERKPGPFFERTKETEQARVRQQKVARGVKHVA